MPRDPRLHDVRDVGWLGLRAVARHFPARGVGLALVWATASCLALRARPSGAAALADWAEDHSLAPSFTVVGGFLFVLLGSRLSLSYARWWEGRSAWGQLIYAAIHTAQQVRHTLRPGPERSRIVALLCVFPFACAVHLHNLGREHHLREEVDELDLGAAVLAHIGPGDLAAASGGDGAWGPHYCLDAMRGQVARAFGNPETLSLPPAVHGAAFLALDGSLSQLGLVIGIAIKVKSTPTPPLYDSWLGAALTLYLAMAPFVLYTAMGLLAIPTASVIAAALLAVLHLAHMLQDPFDYDLGTDLPLYTYSQLVQAQVLATEARRHMFGGTEQGGPGGGAPTDSP
mmetsp:Transcript_9325/g.27674  ORF Transcript_9325/g.27674 Transcript_9325/m.27674 type:complete len:343 (+) Transcript_9325:66-1094(+)